MIRADVFAAAALLAGCAALPSVNYHQIGPSQRADSWVPFRLTDSIIVVGAPSAAKADAAGGVAAAPVDLAAATVSCSAAGCDPVAIAAVPTDFLGVLYGLEPASRRLVSTSAAPTYFTNSLRLKTLAIEAKDHRLEAINTVAAITGLVAKVAGGDLHNVAPNDGDLVLPVAIRLSDARCATATCAAKALPNNPGWTYTLVFIDAAATGLLPRAAIGDVHGAMPVSACRRVTLTLVHTATKATVALGTEVADPEWLITVPFPAKGALTFHPLCGVDVQPQAVTEIGVDTMAAAFVNGVEQVAAQQKK